MNAFLCIARARSITSQWWGMSRSKARLEELILEQFEWWMRCRVQEFELLNLSTSKFEKTKGHWCSNPKYGCSSNNTKTPSTVAPAISIRRWRAVRNYRYWGDWWPDRYAQSGWKVTAVVDSQSRKSSNIWSCREMSMLIIENSTCYILCSYMFYLEKHGIKVFACWEHERVPWIHVLNVLV